MLSVGGSVWSLSFSVLFPEMWLLPVTVSEVIPALTHVESLSSCYSSRENLFHKTDSMVASVSFSGAIL